MNCPKCKVTMTRHSGWSMCCHPCGLVVKFLTEPGKPMNPARPAWIDAAAAEINDYPRWREHESADIAAVIEKHWQNGRAS